MIRSILMIRGAQLNRLLHNHLICLLVSLSVALSAQVVPDGFNDELITDDFSAPVGVTFPDSNLAYVWEQNGYVYVVQNGVKLPTPLLDIHEEVSAGGDHGMLGLVLDPAFSKNGYLYVSYVVDPHHLRYHGTPEYDPLIADTWDATIGRVTRFQVDIDDLKSLIPDSRKVLLGETIDTGIPVVAAAHGVGGLDFGTDGTLLIGTGDGNTWVGDHTGGENYKEFGFDSLGKELGILIPEQDVGSFRSQQIESYNGKVLRVDPGTGLGIASNPFYDSLAPDAAKSKVWALGLRSPFRLKVRPGSGSQHPSEGRPGVIYIGDVGGNQFEELNIAGEPARNFGWPLYEGMSINHGFYDQWISNPYAVNEQHPSQTCSLEFFRFNDLLVQPQKDHYVDRTHPCADDQDIPENQQIFIHERPAISYGNSKNNPELTFTPIFSVDGSADDIMVNHPLSPVVSIPFDGISSIAGDFYTGKSFPEEYRNTYFHGDFSGWIKNMKYDTHGIDEIHEIHDFKQGGSSVVYVSFNPFEDALYYVVLDYSDRPNIYQLRKITFGGNPKPTARITVDTTYGPSPLQVNLSASQSFDPGEEALSYKWELDKNHLSQKQDTSILIAAPGNDPFNVHLKLEVSDPLGQIDSTFETISLNNSPPEVTISSIPEDYSYPLDQGLIPLVLEAVVSDAEHKDNELRYHWEIKLKHNDHFHVEFIDTNRISDVSLFALGSTSLDKHSYLIDLTVTDPLGLSGHHTISLEPDLSTSLEEHRLSDQILLYPNPVNQTLYLDLSDVDEVHPRLKVEVLNIMGQSISDFQISHETESIYRLDLQELSPGLFIVVLRSRGDQLLGSKTFIKH